MFQRIGWVIPLALLVLTGCNDRDPENETTDGPNAVGDTIEPGVEWPPSSWAPQTSDGTGVEPPPASGDFGGECSQPEGCDSDSPDWPDCLNVQCSTGDCQFPIFVLDYGYCARSCTDDTQCENAIDGPYGAEFKCLTDGVSGICAPGSNERCDHTKNGQCDDEDETCKFSLIWAADAVYGGVCQPKTIDGRDVGEACDEEAGVFCANDMCLYDVCISMCDPDAAESVCPTGFRCFEEWHPFGTDSSINVDMCLPQYCETNSDCPESFACELGFQFNRNNILRGICLPVDDNSAQSGEVCCTGDECTAQSDEVPCQGATCFDDEDGAGFCSGMCNVDADCPENAYCTIINFGISADPGSAPAQVCREGSGSGRACSTNADCAADDAHPEEACEYVIRGELEGGVAVTEPTVEGRCSTIPQNAVGFDEACGGGLLANACTNEGLCLSTSGGGGFCSQPCRNTGDCPEDALCFGLGMLDGVQAGACVAKARFSSWSEASMTSCRRDADCLEGEHCGLNIIGSSPPVVELLCKGNSGAGSAGTSCLSGMDCASDTCLPQSTDTSEPGYCQATCQRDSDCGEGFGCVRQVVDVDYGAEAKVCRPTATCTPCDAAGTQVCAGDTLCSTVDFPSAGPGLACLEYCAGIGANTCQEGFTCGVHVDANGAVVDDEFVCLPNIPEESCGASLPR